MKSKYNRKENWFLGLIIIIIIIGIGIGRKIWENIIISSGNNATCKLNGVNSSNISLSYIIKGEVYNAVVPSPYNTLYVGEEYALKYNENIKEEIVVLFNKPVFDKKKYLYIKNVQYTNDILNANNVISLNYRVAGRSYYRKCMMSRASVVEKNGKISLYVNKLYPEISYIDTLSLK